MATTYDLDAILRKVAHLISRADHPNTPPAEADACRAKAEEFMDKYRIDEAALGDAGKLPGYTPMWRTIVLCNYPSEFALWYRTMAYYIIEHLEMRGTATTASVNGEPKWVAEVVGYESDVRFAELLMAQCALAFGGKLEPKYDPALSHQENAYAMRSAGMEGKRIAMAIFGKCDKGDPPKVRKMFKNEALKRGEDPNVLLGQGNSVKTFRDSYAEGFVGEIVRRLQDMRMHRGADGVLVLKSRKEKIDEAFYERHPGMRPRPVSAAIGDTAPCQKCAKAKSGFCRDHSYRRPTKGKERSFNVNAYYRGQTAARTVDLGGEK